MSRSPSSSFASTYSSGTSSGQSRAEPEQTPKQRDEDQARADLDRANHIAGKVPQLDKVPAARWDEEREELSKELETFAARLKSPAGVTPSANADNDRAATVAAVDRTRKAIEHAKRPRVATPVAGEIEIEPRIADKSISPEDVVDWMAGLPKGERSAVWTRYTTRDPQDRFATALANYVSKHRDRTPPLSRDLQALATMDARTFAQWQADRDALAANTSGQSKPLDPLGQSRALDPAGQSFADPTRDADHDGRADLLAQPTRAPVPVVAGTDHGRDLVAYGDGAIAAANNLPASVASYVSARDALDLGTLQRLAIEIATAYEKVRAVDSALAPYTRPVDAASTPSQDAAADRGRLTPIAGALDAAIAMADAQLSAHIGPTAFRGRVIAGADLGPLPGNPDRALARIFQESLRTGAVVATVIEVRDLMPPDGAAPPAPSARTIADKIARTATRPAHFSFVKTALSSLGLWHLVESATAADGRALTRVDQDAAAQAARFGAGVELGNVKPDQALALLRSKPDDPNYYEVTEERAIQVFKLIESMPDPLTRAAFFRDLNHLHPQLVAALAETAPFANARRAFEGLPTGGAGPGVAAPLFQRFADQDTADHSLSHYFGSVPGIGGPLNFTANLLTGGFVAEHDAAYRKMRAGEISEADYIDATEKAMARAAAVAAVSYATGGAAGAYAEGVTASLAARGIAGRIAAGTITGVAAGAGGGFGSRLGNDVIDQRVSGLGEYAHDIGMGAAVGGAFGATASTVGVAGSAIARNLPDHLKTPIHWFSERFPALADDPDLFSAIRELGVRHSTGVATLVTNPVRALQLIREGVADAPAKVLAVFQQSGPDLAIAGGGRVRMTIEARGNLHEPGPLKTPALHIQHAERLDDAGSLFDDYGRGATYADDAADWRSLDHDQVSELPRGLRDDRVTTVDALTAGLDGIYGRATFRDGLRGHVYERARADSRDGVVRDPVTDLEISLDSDWQMGHLPGWEFRKHQASAARRNLTREQFVDEYNDVTHYRPETAKTNQSHELEAPDHVDHWADLEP